MGVCLYANCTSDQADKSISFFRLPVATSFKQAKQWFLRAKRADMTVDDIKKGSHYVCEKHFLPEQLYQQDYGGKTRPRVKPGEIPQPMKFNSSAPFSNPRATKRRMVQVTTTAIYYYYYFIKKIMIYYYYYLLVYYYLL